MNHLLSLIKDRQEVDVLDVGSGPNAMIDCTFAGGLYMQITPIDRRDFPGVHKMDMENLKFPDNHFDIVQCVNALDHTKDAKKAVQEMIRVAKDAVYIDCNLDQRKTSGGWHYWDAKEDGTLVSQIDSFNLKVFGFEIEYINNGGETRYNHIIARLRK